jgi:DNA-binding NtrC family response regulator
MRILVIDDEPRVLKSLTGMLRRFQHTVVECASGVDALSVPDETLESVDIAIVDLVMPELDGLKTGQELRERHPRVFLIMVTGHGTVQSAVQAMREGLFGDYLEKPVDENLLQTALLRAKNVVDSKLLHTEAEGQLLKSYQSKTMIGNAPAYLKARKLAEKAAGSSNTTVLIRGASGTGKELMARFIHETGRRAKKPFVGINCAALPKELVESELFGHEKGAFSGAFARRTGRFEVADGGTLLLDEIAELPLELQPKLLRALQEREFERIGGTTRVKVDIRVIAATGRDIAALVDRGEFRGDLFYRLNVIEIYLPPLAERRTDIPMLASYFFSKHAKHKVNLQGIAPEALEALQDYHWPGNIRELENAIEGAVTRAEQQVITLSDLPDAIALRTFRPSSAQGVKLYYDGLDFERAMIDLVEVMLSQKVASREIGRALTPAKNPTQVFASFWTQDKIVDTFRRTPLEDTKARWPNVLLDLSRNRRQMMARNTYPTWMLELVS